MLPSSEHVRKVYCGRNGILKAEGAYPASAHHTDAQTVAMLLHLVCGCASWLCGT